MSRFRRGRDPRAGRRPVVVPATPPPVLPDGPREELVPPPADTGRHHLPPVGGFRPAYVDESWEASPDRPALQLVHSVQEEEPAPVTEPMDAVMPDGLPASRVEHLERLTDLWQRQARIAGAGPDATMFYAAAPKPPPPAVARPAAPLFVEAKMPAENDPRAVAATVPAEQTPPEPAPAAPVVGAWTTRGASQVPPVTPAGRVLDWTSRHDPQSLEFAVRDRLNAAVPIQDRVWDLGPVFDQGTCPPLDLHDASGCVGMATAAAANVLELATLPAWTRPERATGLLTHDDALALYGRAQELDAISGSDYPGTSVLAGMLAGREAGHWASFLWSFGTRDLAQAVLQVGPAVVGIPWDASLDEPDDAAVIVPGGTPAGGHALAVVGLVLSRAGRPGPFFVLQQSRGPEHGDQGRVYLHHEHLSALLAGVGEAAIPVPFYQSGSLS